MSFSINFLQLLFLKNKLKKLSNFFVAIPKSEFRYCQDIIKKIHRILIELTQKNIRSLADITRRRIVRIFTRFLYNVHLLIGI